VIQRHYVSFQLNVPERIALAYEDGVLKDGMYGPRVMYTLMDGRIMWLDPEVAQKINLAEIQPHQVFWLCKRRGAGKGAKTRWDLYLEDPTPRSEETGLERDLRLSISQAQKQNGNGSDGHLAHAKVVPQVETPPAVDATTAPHPTKAIARSPVEQQQLPWQEHMVSQANALTDVFAQVLAHVREAHGEGVTHEDVRTLVVTTYIQNAKGSRG
jgi:hypothetical protein